MTRDSAVNKCTCSIPEMDERGLSRINGGRAVPALVPGTSSFPGASLSCRWLGMVTLEGCREGFGDKTQSLFLCHEQGAPAGSWVRAASQTGLISLLLLWVHFKGCS